MWLFTKSLQARFYHRNFPYHPKKVAPHPRKRDRGGVRGTIDMLNQYGLNVFPGTPRPPKGGTRGLLARADPRRCLRTIDCARRRGAGPAGAAGPVDRRPVGAGALHRRRRGRGGFCFVQHDATLDAANRAARQPSRLPTSAMRAGAGGRGQAAGGEAAGPARGGERALPLSVIPGSFQHFCEKC